MKLKAYFFDLDGTLYDEESGLYAEINRRIDEWILRTVPLSRNEAKELRKRLFKQYGGTLPGLAAEFGSDYYASMRYCHDVRPADYLEPNQALRNALMNLPGNKYVFTSSYRFYANHVLNALGILDCFDGIIDAIDVYPRPKPSPYSFRRALEITGEQNAACCAFLDDQPVNVAAGHREGFFAVQVGTLHPCSEEADAHIGGIEQILSIPEFNSGRTGKPYES